MLTWHKVESPGAFKREELRRDGVVVGWVNIGTVSCNYELLTEGRSPIKSGSYAFPSDAKAALEDIVRWRQ
jgi:hypothetical protein